MFNNILVAFDGSAHAHRAAQLAAEICKVFPGSKCTLLTIATFTKEDALFLGAASGEYENAEKTYVDKIFGDVKKIFAEMGIPAVTAIRDGDPARRIVDFAGENNVDHIFIGSRGLGNIAGALLGSVSVKVIHQAKCAVTVVK